MISQFRLQYSMSVIMIYLYDMSSSACGIRPKETRSLRFSHFETLLGPSGNSSTEVLPALGAFPDIQRQPSRTAFQLCRRQSSICHHIKIIRITQYSIPSMIGIHIYIIKYQKNQKNNDVLIYPHIISHPGIWMCSCVGFLQHFNLLRNAWNTSSSFSSFLSFFHLIECQLPRHFQCLQHQCLGSIWWSHCLPSFCPKSWRPTSNLYHSPHPNPQFASHDLHTLVLMECIRHWCSAPWNMWP